MGQIPDFTDTELWIIRSTVKERYGRDVPVELAETESRDEGPAAEERLADPVGVVVAAVLTGWGRRSKE